MSAAPVTTSVPADPPRWEPRVLVVDDDPVVRLAATRLLERLGLIVEVAVDGREAMRMSARWPYVAIFMDCSMPDLDGYEATREIHSRAGAGARPFIVAVTSRPRHVCIAAGMDHHIAKPLRGDRLGRECRRLGLLAAAQPAIVPADGLEAAERALATAAGHPSLAELPDVDPVRAAELALAYVARVHLCLPGLWRAANVADREVLLRTAEDLAARARNVRAQRIAALLDLLASACRDERPELGERIVSAVRAELEVLAQTAEARRVGKTGRPDAATTRSAPGPRPGRALRVAVADDDPLARMAVEAMIERGEGLELVGSAEGTEEIVALAAECEPDVVVVDFAMPGGGGPAAARRIRERRPRTRVVAFTASQRPDTYLTMLQAGADGLLVKGAPAARLVELIHRAAARAS